MRFYALTFLALLAPAIAENVNELISQAEMNCWVPHFPALWNCHL